MSWKIKGFVAAAVAAFGVALNAPVADAMPGPTCPGNGNDSVFIGADGGWCNFMYMPDPRYGVVHVSCRWADWSFLLGDLAGHTECRRVDDSGNLLPDSPPWGLMGNWGANEGSGGQGTPPGPPPGS